MRQGSRNMMKQDANQLSTITLPNLSTINYQYDNAGNLSQISYPNGTYTTYGYDTRNRLTALNNNNPAGIISQYAYTLDGIGNRTSITLQEPLSPVPNPVPVDYSYFTGNLLNTASGTSYGYDSNGNQVTKTQGGNTTTFGYDSLNRLINFLSPSFNIQYQYDGLNNRVSKTVNGTTTNYLVDSNGYLPQVVEELDNGGNITSYYVHDRMVVVAKITSIGNVYYYHYNGLGSTIAMTDSNGNMVNKYAYDEFGNVLSQQEMISNPFKYVGQFGVMDEGNGLLYMRARYYDSGVGRFINRDPIGLRGGDLNLFSYTEDNPITNVDPLGLCDCPGGEWSSFSLPAVSAFWGGGGTIARTTYKCKTNNRICKATSICFGGGVIAAVGIGFDFGAPTKSTVGVENVCNISDFSNYSDGIYLTGGLFSVTYTGSSKNVGISKSWGGGLAYITCTNVLISCN